jgi:anti-repressor protein
MNELQIFNNPEFGQIRVIEKNNEPWFVAKDVCEVLELTNPTVAIGRLDTDEVAKFNLGRQGETNLINEYGLYSLILGSRKPEAKKFKRWITHEVIPSIRKTGIYKAKEINSQMLFQIAQQLEEKEKQIALMAPKALFADAVETSHTSILVGDLAKLLRQNGYDIGQNRLFIYLRDKGFLIKSGSSRNMPTQKSMDMGLFEVKERAVNNPDGSVIITKTTKVTGKGQVYFINHFLEREKAI